MPAFQLNQLLAERARGGGPYVECLRVPALSAGLYVLLAGGTDPQQPHREDEVYPVLSGRGRIRVGNEDQSVELRVLVFFAPAETSPAPSC